MSTDKLQLQNWGDDLQDKARKEKLIKILMLWCLSEKIPAFIFFFYQRLMKLLHKIFCLSWTDVRWEIDGGEWRYPMVL